MRIPVEHEAEVRRIISAVPCPWQKECCDSGVERHIRIHYLGGADLVECRDDCGRNCCFAVPFGYSIFCRCPLRKYLAAHGLAQ
jgi:hypothetical protein